MSDGQGGWLALLGWLWRRSLTALVQDYYRSEALSLKVKQIRTDAKEARRQAMTEKH
ncbi:MAG: hypothetical protein HOL85_11640 [Rhodospirillaceae bacterium]|jgi:hypothetical protein|nr:hypothetical protein [Rhodospirillaceae bacterium]MBT6138816.1 hypothetical protein [Rhodospirillaceae bacterium]